MPATELSNSRTPAAEEDRNISTVYDSVRNLTQGLKSLPPKAAEAFQKIDSHACVLQTVADQAGRLESSVNALVEALLRAQVLQQGFERRVERYAHLPGDVDRSVAPGGEESDDVVCGVPKIADSATDRMPLQWLINRHPELEQPRANAEAKRMDRLKRLHPLFVRLLPPSRSRRAPLVVVAVAGLAGLFGGALLAHIVSVPHAPVPLASQSDPVSALPPEAAGFAEAVRDESDSSAAAVGQEQPAGEPVVSEALGNLFVSLAATETTWVSLAVDGQAVFAGLLAPGDTRNFQAAERMRLRVGNAAGVNIVWNGRPIGPIGERGEVYAVNFTRGEFQTRRLQM